MSITISSHFAEDDNQNKFYVISGMSLRVNTETRPIIATRKYLLSYNLMPRIEYEFKKNI